MEQLYKNIRNITNKLPPKREADVMGNESATKRQKYDSMHNCDAVLIFINDISS